MSSINQEQKSSSKEHPANMSQERYMDKDSQSDATVSDGLGYPEKVANIQEEDMEYISDINAALLMRTPKGGRLILYIMVLAVICSIVWASLSKIDEVTRGMGSIIPSSRLQVIQNLEGGILQELYVMEGQQVSAGQPLMQLDDTQFSSSFRESNIDYFGELAKATRLTAELSGKSLVFPKELDEYRSYIKRERDVYNQRARRLKAELEVFNKQSIQAGHDISSAEARLIFLTNSYNLGRDELNLTIPLAQQGLVSRVELIQLKQRVNDLESEKRMTELNIPKLRVAYQESLARKEEIKQQFREQVVEELQEVELNLDHISESNDVIEDQVDRTLIRSPMDGIIKKTYVTTIGGVVKPGMDLMEIVPIEDSLMVEAKIQPKDIGFLSIGMKAIVKLTAYDFAIYGGLEGKLKYISADTIKDEKGESFYIVHVETNKNYIGTESKKLMIIPGMMANVDVITGKKTLIQYMLKPILKAKQNALTER